MGSDPEKLFPFDALLGQFKQFGVYSIYVATFLLPMIYGDPKSLPDTDTCVKADLNDPNYANGFCIPDSTKHAYNRIVVDIFDDLTRLDFL